MYPFLSFDEFVETLYRGNEVILEYKENQYSITPSWSGDVVNGFYINKVYDEVFVCATPMELANFMIEGSSFAQLFPQMKVIDRVI